MKADEMREVAAHMVPHGTSGSIRHIGFDIYVRERPNNPTTVVVDGSEYHRFLDNIYLPCPTNKLSIDQVCTINNYRSSIFQTDSQFKYNRDVRSIIRTSIDDAYSIVEFGPSVQPMYSPARLKYLLVDIDEMAVGSLRQDKYVALNFPDFERSTCVSYDIALGIFVFQFSLLPDQAVAIANSINEFGVLVFNMLTKSSQITNSVLNCFSDSGLEFSSIDLMPYLGKQDSIYLAHGPSGARRARDMRDAMICMLDSSVFKQ